MEHRIREKRGVGSVNIGLSSFNIGDNSSLISSTDTRINMMRKSTQAFKTKVKEKVGKY